MNGQQRRMNERDGAGDGGENQMDRTKLIINYIPQFTSEEELANIFSQVGQIESIRIMRDFRNGYSYGFGLVKYTKSEFATKAIEIFNGMKFRNKRLKVSYSRPAGQDMKDSNLYITNLPKNFTEEDIAKTFGEYGEIIQKTILRDKITGLPRGVAFVRYVKAEEAQAAIAALDGKQLENAMLPLSIRVAEDHGRQKTFYFDCTNHEYLYNTMFNKRQDGHIQFDNNVWLNMNGQQRRMNERDGAGDGGENQMDRTKVIINYIPQFASEEELAKIFSQVGQIESIRIMRDFRTGHSYGFGFVKYRKSEFATKAIETFNGMHFRNKRLKVSYSRPAGQDMKDSNLYITNLPMNVTEEYIANMFGKYGEIIQKTILKDKRTGLPRGVAFVRYAKTEDAQAAFAALDGKQLEDAMLPLEIRVAEDYRRQKAHYLDYNNMNYLRAFNTRDRQQFISNKIEAWKQMNLDRLYNFTGPTHGLFYQQLINSVQHTLSILLEFLDVRISDCPFSCALQRQEGIYGGKRRLVNFDQYANTMETRLQTEQQKASEAMYSTTSPASKRRRYN